MVASESHLAVGIKSTSLAPKSQKNNNNMKNKRRKREGRGRWYQVFSAAKAVVVVPCQRPFRLVFPCQIKKRREERKENSFHGCHVTQLDVAPSKTTTREKEKKRNNPPDDTTS